MLEQDLQHIVESTLPHLSPTAVNSIVVHLVSDQVGVSSIVDLKDVTAEYLAPLNLAPIPVKKLLKAFHSGNDGTSSSKDNTTSNHPTPGCSSWDSQTSVEDGQSSESGPTGSTQFTFRVQWGSLPRATLDLLEVKDLQDKRAAPGDESTLKLAIAKKIVQAYVCFKESHPGVNKHPGLKIYRDVTRQVFRKFPNCFKDMVNGKVVGDGQGSFTKLLKICIENLMRNKSQSKPKRAVRAKGIVGILHEEYEPIVINPEEQAGVREHLQNMHKLNPSSWNREEIRRDMINTYELQREDIVKVKEKVEETEEKDAEQENNDEDNVFVKAIVEVKSLWPFLFETDSLSLHHKRLTGRELYPHLAEFMKNKLDFFLLYLTTQSSSGVSNLALRLKNEKYLEAEPFAPKKLWLLILMLTKYFKENNESLVLPVEKTTMLCEVEITAKEPCILALGDNAFEAESFFLCVDGVGLMAVTSFAQALVSLIELCFAFDLQYPLMPLTMEFIERCIFQMAICDTRVRDKKGKELLVLTTAVRDLANGEEKFEVEVTK